MSRNIAKSIAAMTFMVLTTLPAAAQISFTAEFPLPGLDIRIGQTAPPSLRTEQRPRRPSREYLWLQGSWDWQGHDWTWVPGRWERPNDRGSRWVRARYVREGRAWRYEPSHWSNQRLTEGEEYRRWKDENGRDQHGNHGHGHDQDRDRDHDHDLR